VDGKIKNCVRRENLSDRKFFSYHSNLLATDVERKALHIHHSHDVDRTHGLIAQTLPGLKVVAVHYQPHLSFVTMWLINYKTSKMFPHAIQPRVPTNISYYGYWLLANVISLGIPEHCIVGYM
jgi:hypothetical protein